MEKCFSSFLKALCDLLFYNVYNLFRQFLITENLLCFKFWNQYDFHNTVASFSMSCRREASTFNARPSCCRQHGTTRTYQFWTLMHIFSKVQKQSLLDTFFTGQLPFYFSNLWATFFVYLWGSSCLCELVWRAYEPLRWYIMHVKFVFKRKIE